MTKAEKSAYDRERYQRLKPEIMERVKAWQRANAERARANFRRSKAKYRDQNRAYGRQRYSRVDIKERQAACTRRRKYGITQSEYTRRLVEQDGLCALCKTPSNSALHVDHCHVTGRVRALLCRHCNTGLGFLKESPELLRQAADYIERHRQ